MSKYLIVLLNVVILVPIKLVLFIPVAWIYLVTFFAGYGDIAWCILVGFIEFKFICEGEF